MEERLQKILSQRGIASRRQAEMMILTGRVQLNGVTAQLGQKANPQADVITIDGQRLSLDASSHFRYLLLHKPAGVVSTCRDPQARPTVLSLLPRQWQSRGLHPVGRLDAASTGALLLTNDGALTFYLTHPRHHVAKTYRVWVKGNPSAAILQQWRQGISLLGRQTRPADVRVLAHCPDSNRTCLEIILREGRNRQIRRVAEQLGHPVVQLHRVAIGPIQLGNLPVGQWRSLTPPEVAALKCVSQRVGDRWAESETDQVLGISTASEERRL
ncbi:rRNA pseudouridine synthase [Trichothermofontia sichuanensis B231]|uniref:pseudouridine synthase n=1 Tax=Trichothermofontia sichuanensis TaxID=3045816 RepID=UPI00224543E0|nr:pseudouridine synthase [Trichothermofontia sichuanensis]UZQ53123.1 rRNA pseudouridine synthase [Trichothermofontia sichuanensis B231]